MRARPQLPGGAVARAEGAAEVPPEPLFLGLRRGLGTLLRVARQRDGDLPHAVRAVWAAELCDVASGAAGDRHRNPPLRLGAPTGDRLSRRAYGAVAARGRDRDRPLHQLAGPG